MSNAKGFSLIELMIALAIAAILTAIAMPAYNKYIARGKLAEAYSNMSSLQARMEQYYQDNRMYGTAAACGITPTASTNFTYACVTGSCSGSPATSCQTFTVTATGRSGMTGFTFTVNDAGTKATTVVPAGWTTNAACWIANDGGGC